MEYPAESLAWGHPSTGVAGDVWQSGCAVCSLASGQRQLAGESAIGGTYSPVQRDRPAYAGPLASESSFASIYEMNHRNMLESKDLRRRNRQKESPWIMNQAAPLIDAGVSPQRVLSKGLNDADSSKSESRKPVSQPLANALPGS